MEEENSRKKDMMVEVLGEPVALAPTDLYDARFKRSLFGFNSRDIRAFLDSVADDIERLIEQNRRLKFQVGQLQDQLAEYRRTEESLKNALISSEKLRSDLLADAKKKAELILNEARLEAKQIYHNAEKTREDIERQVATLNVQQERFKAEFAALLDAHKRLLNTDFGARSEEDRE